MRLDSKIFLLTGQTETQQSLDAFYTVRLEDMAAFHLLSNGQKEKHQVHVPKLEAMTLLEAIDSDLYKSVRRRR